MSRSVNVSSKPEPTCVARWLTDVSPFAHAFAAMISSEFTGLETTVDATGSPVFSPFVSICFFL